MAERGITFGQYNFYNPINKNPEDKQKKKSLALICMKTCPQVSKRIVFFQFSYMHADPLSTSLTAEAYKN